ncbi:MAG TPA: SpoIIE family protein phosphatase [Thermoanaerobaculia bacterium]|nr:SpoIIE family protein phosphatase [Thermoanaerobaculia bacterium]
MRKRTLLPLTLIGVLLLCSFFAHLAGLRGLYVLTLWAAVVLIAVWGGFRLFRRFLWRVGRKLAFSYFLIGVLPIPMVAILIGVALWLLSGALVGHLFRDTAVAFHREIEETTAEALDGFRDGHPRLRDGDVLLAYYKDGKRAAGASFAPEAWPEWLVQPGKGDEGLSRHVPLMLDPRGRLTLAAAVEGADGTAALGIYQGDLDRELRERSGLWVEIAPWSAAGQRVDVQLFGHHLPVSLPMAERKEALRREFFGTANRELPLFDRPFLAWVEKLGPARTLTTTPRKGAQEMGALLNATPRTLVRQVVSSSADIDAAAWGVLLVVAFLLFDIYAAATLMALFLIYGLSRAVNRLSRATDIVRRGDFSVRIPVRRKDQLGELQRLYNEMAASLQELVATTAQKESLEKELQVARELQQSLLPSSLTTTEAVEMASYFEPSAAIGGDYFDLLKVDDGRFVVVVADVSGHGLSAGLRMAMLKAALVMLVEQRMPAHEVFERLNRLVREGQGNVGARPLVTATLATFDPRSGSLELTNAGHVPTYVLHDGKVQEILLPSPPLGVLGDRYARAEVKLVPGDLVVWLSDGLVETADPDGEPFGYDAVQHTLAGGGTAAQVRDRLLARVAAHSKGAPPADDRTLVVLRYLARQEQTAPAIG